MVLQEKFVYLPAAVKVMKQKCAFAKDFFERNRQFVVNENAGTVQDVAKLFFESNTLYKYKLTFQKSNAIVITHKNYNRY